MTEAGFIVQCGPADANGRRAVKATYGKIKHGDRFDIDDAFKRRKFREAVIAKFDLDDSAHEHLETKILAAAEAGASPFKPVITLLDTIAPTPVRFLWKPRIIIGKINLLCGDPGLGKSLVTLDMAARESRANLTPMLVTKRGFSGGWLWSLPEDDAKATVGHTHKQSVTFDETCHLRINPEEDSTQKKTKYILRAKATGCESVNGHDAFDELEAERQRCANQRDIAF